MVLFIIPHILAFGRGAWVSFAFTIFIMVVLHSLRKRQFKVLFRQAVVLILMSGAVVFSFIQFIPESDYYIDAVKARLTQGQEDIKYSEGTYGTRILMQNNALTKLWSENDLFLGVGMHPMWWLNLKHGRTTCYGAFCDVGWPAVLAAYGLIGMLFAVILQFYFIFISYKLIRKIPEGSISAFFLVVFLSKLLVDTLISFSISFVSTGLWGFFFIYFYIAFVAYSYEKNKEKELETLKSQNQIKKYNI
jgi:hypothetical protein